MRQQLRTSSQTERTRAHKPKVRTGCVTCKSRRVKCDETKPSCLVCMKSGRQCDGYVPLKTWIFEVRSRDATSSPPSLIPLPSSGSGEPMDGRALMFFREKTAPVLSSFATAAHEFFTSTILQAGHVDPIVKHMIIATASLQEASLCKPGPQSVNRWVFGHHYSKAIALLTGPGTNPSVESVLMACLLFLACENFQGSTMAGLLHIYSGLKILKDWKASKRCRAIAAGSADDVIEHQIDPIFARLEAQTTVYRSANTSRHSYYSETPTRLQSKPSVPSAFTDLFLARDSLDEVMQWMFYILDMNPDGKTDAAVVFQIRDLLDQWHLSSKAYAASLSDHDQLERRTASALDIHYRILSIMLNVTSTETELIYDSYLPEFRALLSQCEEIIKYRETGPTDNWAEYNSRMSLFEFEFGMVVPLFLIACRCRDPVLRRKAIRLLRYLHRTEGAWDTCSAGKIAEGIMEIEERGLTLIESCESLTESSRIRAMNADVDPAHPSEVLLSFSHFPYDFVEQEFISWASWSRNEIASRTLWPLENVIRRGGYQGLVCPVPGACLCKVYQAQKVHDEFTEAEIAIRRRPMDQ